MLFCAVVIFLLILTNTTTTALKTIEKMTKKPTRIDDCDYLVVGSGAAPLAFVDTILAEMPSAKIVIVDKKAAPGGQWVDACE